MTLAEGAARCLFVYPSTSIAIGRADSAGPPEAKLADLTVQLPIKSVINLKTALTHSGMLSCPDYSTQPTTNEAASSRRWHSLDAKEDDELSWSSHTGNSAGWSFKYRQPHKSFGACR